MVYRRAVLTLFLVYKCYAPCLILMRSFGDCMYCSNQEGNSWSMSMWRVEIPYQRWYKVSPASWSLPDVIWDTNDDTRLIDIYNTIWPFFLGNCQLNRTTQQSIMQAGNWDNIDLSVPTAEDAWLVFPRISGRLSKKPREYDVSEEERCI